MLEIKKEKILKIKEKLGFEYIGTEVNGKLNMKQEIFIFKNKDIIVYIDIDFAIFDFENDFERKGVVNGIATQEQLKLDRKNTDMLWKKAEDIVDILTEDMPYCEECGELIWPKQERQMMYGLTENEHGETILDLDDEMGIAHTDCLEMFMVE